VETLEQDILNTEQVIARLPSAQIRNLDRSLRNLSPAQRAYVANSLRSLQDDKTMSPRYLQLLEYFFEKWSSHGLATKLVLISRITRLSSGALQASIPGGDVSEELFSLPQLLHRAS
jgi:hypothetical protein